jgi:NADPH2:quinone reductase
VAPSENLAIVIDSFGGPEVLHPRQWPRPVPGPGELLLRLSATGVNFVDTYHRTGAYPRQLPFVPGSEAAGRVEAFGEGVTGFAVGDRIGSVNVNGSYASYAPVPADRAVRLPDGVDDVTAAAALLQGMTAHYLCFDVHPVRPGETVLVHAAAGGMGLLLTQLAAKLGATVIGTTSTEAKAELARQAGAAEVIRYDQVDVATQVRRLTGGAGVAAVYDGVGRATFDASLASLRPRGMFALYGAASGQPEPLDLSRLAANGSLVITRPTLAHFVVDRAELLRRAEDVLGWVADGSLRISVSQRYPLAEAARAHEDLESRRTTGKLVLVP